MKKKLLLADDSATIQKVIQLCFADEPFEVQVAQDGPRAVELLLAWRPDILLVDALLPEFDGYQLCKRAKQENKIPVVLLVGTFEPFDFGRAEEAGYDAYLTKPFDTARLIDITKELADRVVKEEPRPMRKTWLLEFEQQPLPASPGVLQIEEYDLSPWDREITPRPEPPLPPIPIHRAADRPLHAAASRDLEAELVAVVERLLPGWMATLRTELLEELGRSAE